MTRPDPIARILAVAMALTLWTAGSAQGGLFWTETRLNQDATTELQNEEQIAINPTDPGNMVAVWRDFRLGYRQVGWAYTFDGGASWTEGGLLVEPNYPWQSDPGVTADQDGNFYAVVLSVNEALSASGIFVLRSTDGGATWGSPLEVVNNVPDVFEDKEFLACDRTEGPHSGNLYVAWTRISASTQIVFKRSTDSGLTWSETTPVSGTSGVVDVQFPIPVVGRQGEVYVAFGRRRFGSSSIRVKVSTDGGVTFGSQNLVAQTTAFVTSLNGGVDAFGSPHMDADITDGPFSGRVYCSFMDQRDGSPDNDIWVTWSDDLGASWSTPVRVNDDTPANGRDQFHPWLTVDNLGVVTVAFLDRRDDPANLEYHCYLAQSTDGGATWLPNEQVSSQPSNPLDARVLKPVAEAPLPSTFPGSLVRTGPTFPAMLAGLLGEYIGVVAWNGAAVPIWTDIRNGNQDVFTAFGGGATVTPRSEGASAEFRVYPNPARRGQPIVLAIPSEGQGRVDVFDVAGRLLRTFDVPAGSARWDGRGRAGEPVPLGFYFFRVERETGTSRGRVLIVE